MSHKVRSLGYAKVTPYTCVQIELYWNKNNTGDFTEQYLWKEALDILKDALTSKVDIWEKRRWNQKSSTDNNKKNKKDKEIIGEHLNFKYRFVKRHQSQRLIENQVKSEGSCESLKVYEERVVVFVESRIDSAYLKQVSGVQDVAHTSSSSYFDKFKIKSSTNTSKEKTEDKLQASLKSITNHTKKAFAEKKAGAKQKMKEKMKSVFDLGKKSANIDSIVEIKDEVLELDNDIAEGEEYNFQDHSKESPEENRLNAVETLDDCHHERNKGIKCNDTEGNRTPETCEKPAEYCDYEQSDESTSGAIGTTKQKELQTDSNRVSTNDNSVSQNTLESKESGYDTKDFETSNKSTARRGRSQITSRLSRRRQQKERVNRLQILAQEISEEPEVTKPEVTSNKTCDNLVSQDSSGFNASTRTTQNELSSVEMVNASDISSTSQASKRDSMSDFRSNNSSTDATKNDTKQTSRNGNGKNLITKRQPARMVKKTKKTKELNKRMASVFDSDSDNDVPSISSSHLSKRKKTDSTREAIVLQDNILKHSKPCTTKSAKKSAKSIYESSSDESSDSTVSKKSHQTSTTSDTNSKLEQNANRSIDASNTSSSSIVQSLIQQAVSEPDCSDDLDIFSDCFVQDLFSTPDVPISIEDDEEEAMKEEIKLISDVARLNLEQIDYLVSSNERYLRDIFQGKTYSRRHEDYKSGGRKRVKLAYELPLGEFKDEQHDRMMEALKNIFCKNHFKYMDYLLKVMLPEILIKIYMDVTGMKDREAAEELLMQNRM